MTDRTTGKLKPKGTINHPINEDSLDPNDPNDHAFKLVITFVFSCDVYFTKKTQYLALLLPYSRPISHSLHTIVSALGGLSRRYST